MKKIYLFLATVLMCSLSYFSFGTTATINATSVGNVTGANVVTAGTMKMAYNTTAASKFRGYAIFNLSSIPAGAIISSVTLQFTYTVSGTGTAAGVVYGYAGDISSLAAASQYAACVSGTSFYTTSTGTAWGTSGTTTLVTPLSAENNTDINFLNSRLNATISMCWDETGSARIYTETTVPQLVITYTTNPLPSTYATLPFSENFETSWANFNGTSDRPGGSTSWGNIPATGNLSWRRDDDAAGSNTAAWTLPTSYSYTPGGSTIGVASGTHSARFHQGYAQHYQGSLVLAINLPAGTKTIAYDYINGSSTTGLESSVQVQVSTDGGYNWTNIGSAVNGPVGWTRQTITTTAASTTALIRWLASGDYGSYDIGIDNVSICTSIPATPTSVTAAPTALCAGSNISLSASVTGASYYKWVGPNSFSSSAAGTAGTATVTTAPVAASGIYTVAASSDVNFACYSYGTTSSVTVNGIPTITTTAPTICSSAPGNTVTFASSGGTGTATWNTSNSGVATIASPGGLATAAGAGTTNISVTQSSCTSANVVLTVNASPTVIITPSSSCTGLSGAAFTASGASTYVWSPTTSLSPGAGTSATETSTNAGVQIYTVTGTAANGCTRTATATSNPTPAVITAGGVTALCSGTGAGHTVVVTSTTVGGTWTIGNAGSAATLSGSGASRTVTAGATAGTATVTYTAASGGCYTTYNITINATPTVSISSTGVYCYGTPTTLTAVPSATCTYAWTGPGATLSATTGISITATPTAAPTAPASTSYTVVATSASNGCVSANATTTIAYHVPVTMIDTSLGGGFVCNPGTTPYIAYNNYGSSVYAYGGAYSSANTSVATVSIYGIVNAVAGGTTTITYSDAACATATMPVRIISGGFTLSVTPSSGIYCTAGTPVHISATGVGATADTFLWSPSTGIDSPAYGIVNASPSVTTIYTVYGTNNSTGCHAGTTVTIANPTPASIGGAGTSVCTGSSVTWTDATGGGTWTSSNTSIASVSAGVVTGVAFGTATITYAISGCYVTRSITVIGAPGTITGITSVCSSSPVTLANSTPGGTWSSSATGVATIGSGTGIVTPISSGTTNITYATGCGTNATTTFTNGTLAPISGVTSVCNVSNLSLTEGWESGVPTVAGTLVDGWNTNAVSTSNWFQASAPSSPTATAHTGTYLAEFNSFNSPTTAGVTAALISPSFSMIGRTGGQVSFWMYREVGGSYATGTYLLEGFNVQLNTTASTSSASTICFIPRSTAGTITGTVSGTASPGTSGWYQYTIAIPGTFNGATNYVLFNALSEYGDNCYLDDIAITATGSVPSTLTDAATGGTWSSSATSVATVGSTTGVITPVSGGATTISYTSGCGTVTSPLTVNSLPGSITGTTSVCSGATISLSNSAPYGTWTSSNTGVATINTSTGVVTGVAAGTTNISYTTGCGLAVGTVVTVYTTPSPITGASTVCGASTITLSDAVGSGTWTSSASGVASVGSSSGIVTGASGGSVTITYTIPAGGCYVTYPVTVSAPAAITGPSSVCGTGTVSLSDATPSGTWSSSNTGVATIDATTGVLTGVAGGTTTISYTTAGCSALLTFNDANALGPITGSSSICAAVPNLSYAEGWESGVPTVPGTLVDGWNTNAAATSNWQSVTTGVSPTCSPNTGSKMAEFNSYNILSGTYTLTSPSFSMLGRTGGQVSFWMFRDNSAYTTSGYYGEGIQMAIGTTTTLGSATVLGFVPRLTAGTTTGFTGVNATGWQQYTVSIPGGFTGSTNYLFISGIAADGNNIFIDDIAITATGSASSITLTDPTSGGTWTSSNTSVATVDASTGVVSGAAAGTTTISYTNLCGTVTKGVTTVGAPAAITGTTTICTGTTSTLANTATGGTWSSSATGVASVDAITGVVTGVAAGSATITYSTGCGTAATVSVTVNTTPVAITGATSLCLPSTTTLSDLTINGTWSSSAPAVASIDATTGVLTAVSAGTTIISYSLCSVSATANVTVNNVDYIAVSPATPTLCAGASTSLTSTAYNPATTTSILTQTFNSGLSGWSVISNFGGATAPAKDKWFLHADGSYYSGAGSGNFHSNDNSQFIMSIADSGGTTSITHTTLTSGTFSLSVGDPHVTLSFYQMYYDYSGDSALVEISTDNGATYSILANYSGGGTIGSITSFVQQQISLNAYVGHTQCKIRFDYYSSYGFYWALDNVSITVPAASSALTTWAPTTGLYTNAGLTTPYTGTAVNTVYAAPSASTTYTATVGSCSTTGSSAVTVNPMPTVYAVTGGAGCSATGVNIGLANSTTGVNYRLWRGATAVGSVVPGNTGSPLSFGLQTTVGTYKVVATNATTGCIDTMSGNVVISTSPAAYSVTGGTGCSAPGVTVGLSNSETSAVSYQLYNGAATVGSPLTGTSGALNFGLQSSAGTYTVLATGAGGCQTNMTGNALVDLAPTAYTVTGGNACSSPGVTVGVSNSQSSISYKLYNGASLVTTISGTTGSPISFGLQTAVGNYTVIGNSGTGCVTNMAGSDTVSQTPSITVGATPNVCQGITSATLSYSGAVGSPTTYSIVYDATAHTAGFTDVSTSLGGSIGLVVPVAAAANNYVGTINVSNGSCTSANYPMGVNVAVYPTAAITSAARPCTGYSTNVVFTGTAGATVVYQVNHGTNLNGTLTSGSYTYSTGALTANDTITFVNVNNVTCTDPIGTDTVIAPILMQWKGTADTDWTNGANWACGFVPGSSDDAIITASYVNAPSLAASGSGTTRNLSIASGVALNLYGSSVLNVKGNLTNNTAITGAGKVSMSGTVAQYVSGIGKVSNLDINNTSGVAVNAGGRMTVTSTLGLSSGYLATGDSVVLASDSVATARILPITAVGAGVSGKVQVMQYFGAGHRAYRFFGHPFSTYIPLSQIEQYIDITGYLGASNGFTPTITNAPSSFRYNPAIANSAMGYDPGWRAFTSAYGASASDTNAFQQYQGIRLFIRGAKYEGLDGTAYIPSAVTVGMSGPINQGNQVVHMVKGAAVSGQDYNMISNPYPSPVDIGTIAYNAKTNGNITGVAIYVWNPYSGPVGQFMAVPINTGTPYSLGPNTSFQVRAAHNGDTLNFTETNKTNAAAYTLLKNVSDNMSLFIYDVNYHPWDVLRMQFNDAATDGEDDNFDAVKPNGPAALNFYSWSADEKKMAIDSRPYKVDKVIPLGINSAVAQDFIMKVEGVASTNGGKVYLHDKLLNQYTLLTDGTEYRFSITADKTTQGDNRFELSLEPTTAIATIKALEVTMQPNPATDEVKISFTSGRKDKVCVRMLDLSGVSVYSTELGVQQNGSVNVSLDKLASGIYMVELTQGDQKVVQRLVKE